jgi:predicted dehydrogenase
MKRRDALKAGAAMGAAMFFPTSPAVAQSTGAEPLNVALIGVGLQGRALVNACLLPPLAQEVRFRAVCDVWDYGQNYGQYYLKSYGQEVNTYADYRRMLDREQELDAVLIASPDFVHAEQAVACMEAGLHVYCETLMSNTLDGARSMVRAMQTSGKLLQIGYQRRSNPRYRHVKEKLLDQAQLAGTVTQVNAQWILALRDDRGWPRRNAIADEDLRKLGYADMREFRNWRWYTKYCSGLFGNLGAHQVDVMNWFLGVPPSAVMASGSSDHDQQQWNKNVMAIYHYATPDRDVQSFCQMLTATRGDGTGSHETFLGTQGSVRISQNPRWTSVYRDPNAPEWDEWVRREFIESSDQQRARRSERSAAEIAETGEVERYSLPVEFDKPVVYPHLANFFDAIRGRAALTCPGDVAFATEVAVVEATRSVASRQRRTLKPEDFRV